MKRFFIFGLCFLLLFSNCKHKGDDHEGNKGQPTEPNCNLRSITFNQSGASLASFDHLVPENMEVSLSATLSENAKLFCYVSTISKTAKVYFDEETDNREIKSYTSLNENKTIKLTCKDGNKEKKYEVKITEAIFNNPSPTDSVKVSVVGFVGGSGISKTKIECFETSNNSLKGTKITDTNGNVFFDLEKGKHYDFVASKKGRAASKLSNIHVRNEADLQHIVMVLHDGAVGFKHVAPEITQIKLGKKDEEPENMTEITDNSSLNLDTLMQDEKGVFIETKSNSGKFIPNREEGHEKNFGLMVGIGHRYSSLEDFPKSLRAEVKTFSNGKEFKKEGEAIIQRYFLPLKNIEATTGKYTLAVVAYDLAGNRVEKHIEVNIEGNITEKANTIDKVTKFDAELKRFPKPLNTFGLPSENGIETSCNVLFSFDVSSEYISAVEVYRRIPQENINAGWAKISARIYTEKFKGIDTFIDNKKGRVFKVADDSNTLEEGKTYQYKLKVFKKATQADKSDEGYFYSPIATLSVLPAFDIKLMSPYHYEKIKCSNLNKLDFSFKISNTNILKKENADYFTFGLLVVDNETSSQGKTKEKGVVYATKLKYYLNDPEKLEVLDRGTGKWKLYSKFNEVKSFKVKDLLDFKEDGTVTIKQNFLKSWDFNLVGGLAFHKCFLCGNMYYWDIQDFGNDYIYIYDDVAATFIKEMALKDSATGEAKAEKSMSYSLSNTTNESNAINGRFAFTIVK
ncbi:MAG: dentilisin complex subunit PrcA [Treponema sp.]